MGDFNPDMLTLAREARGLTQRELAAAMGISQGTLSKYEVGALPITPEDRVKAGSLLAFDDSFFSQNELVHGLGSDFLYRKRAVVPAPVRRRVRAEVNIRRLQIKRLLEKTDALDNAIGFPFIQPEEVGYRVDAVAQEVRNAWKMPRGPVRNLTRVIERAGGIIFAFDFGTDLIDGMNLRLTGEPVILYVNSRASGDRHRFNLAHELGHAVMHSGMTLGDPEVEANAFAREFLMPRADIKTDLRGFDLSVAARLKRVWGVSMAALVVRAYELGSITGYQYKKLNAQLTGSGLRTKEPIEVPVEKAEAFDSLVGIYKGLYGSDSDAMRRLLFADDMIDGSFSEKTKHLRLADDPGLFDGPSLPPNEPSPPSLRFPSASSQ